MHEPSTWLGHTSISGSVYHTGYRLDDNKAVYALFVELPDWTDPRETISIAQLDFSSMYFGGSHVPIASL